MTTSKEASVLGHPNYNLPFLLSKECIRHADSETWRKTQALASGPSSQRTSSLDGGYLRHCGSSEGMQSRSMPLSLHLCVPFCRTCAKCPSHTALLSESSHFLGDIQLSSPNVSLLPCNTLNPAALLPLPDELEEIKHDCV